MNNIKILGSGYAKPLKTITNYDLEKRVDTSHEWIVQRTGITQRYISENENTSDLGYRAALAAIKDAEMEANDIDAIIVATMTPDHLTPSTACLIQEKLGLNHKQIFAVDLNAACSGFLYAFQIACSLLERFEKILIIGSETLSKIIDWQDRSTCVLFGDGAGAMIITKGNSHVYHYADSEGDNQNVLIAKGLSLTKDLTHPIQSPIYLSMQGQEVFRFAVRVMQESIEKVLQLSGLSIDDIDLIIPHQANYRIISHVAKKMKVDISKFYINISEFANTSSATIPIAFGDAKEKGFIHENSKIIMVGFGGGLTYGATLIDGGQLCY